MEQNLPYLEIPGQFGGDQAINPVPDKLKLHTVDKLLNTGMYL
jgi:hypothetical protein